MDSQARELGQFVVADPRICHGQLTFRGTRILVADVLEDVAGGMVWQEIVDDCWGRITLEAIAEAVRLAREALLDRELAPSAA